jgi:hypothetical protein
MANATPDVAGAGAANLHAAMRGADRRSLDAIFRHPLAHNLSWREVVSLFATIGGAEEKPNGEFVLRAGAEHLSMLRPHNKDLAGPEVMELRHFLTRTGWSPDAPAVAAPAAEAGGVIVVIDHAGATIHRIDASGQDESRHVVHHVERKLRDADRDETYPEDERFFAQVAAALAEGGGIVLIGHGTGQSNEAAHLSAYLDTHAKPVAARIVGEIAADLPHLTVPQLLDLGRRAFDQG